MNDILLMVKGIVDRHIHIFLIPYAGNSYDNIPEINHYFGKNLLLRNQVSTLWPHLQKNFRKK